MRFTKQNKMVATELNMTYKILVMLVLISHSMMCFSSIKKQVFHPLYLEEELKAGTTTCSIKDRDGFLWIGTDEGLKRYDGYHLKEYKTKTNFGLPELYCLFITKKRKTLVIFRFPNTILSSLLRRIVMVACG